MSDSKDNFYRELGELIRRGGAEEAISRLEAWLVRYPNDELAASMLGSALQRAGREKDALVRFRQNVASHPDSYAAHGDLGFATMRAGDADAAIDSFRKATSLNPRFYPANVSLARLLYTQGAIDEARRSHAAAEACDPLAGEFRNIQAAMSASKFAEAEKICRGLLARQPGYPKAAYALAHLATTVGAFEESADILEKSLERYPCDVNLRAALVRSLEELGDYEAQLESAAKLVELDSESEAAYLLLGRVHGHCGQYDESLRAFDRARELHSDKPAEVGNVELLRGHALKILGRHDDGVAAYRRSIDLVADNGAGWWGLADMKTVRFEADDIEAMQTIVGNESVKAEQRTQAAFALGKAMEDAGRYADAFSCYRQANDLRTNADFDPEVNRQGIDELIQTMSPEFLDKGSKSPPDGPTPIFITGLPRSGSTLIEQILASHSMIEGTMELVNLPNVVRRITIDGGKRQLEYPASLTGFSAEELRAYGQRYIDSTAIYHSGKPYFIDKLPTNFDKIGLIHMIMPNAVIIDARRHPMDCGFSCFRQHFAAGHHFSYALGNIGHYYNDYLRLIDHWHEVLPGKVLTVQYEDVVADAEGMTRKLLDHVGVPFEDACLRFFENRRPVRTASSEQVRQPIYKKAVQHWKHFEKELQPLAEALGPETLARFD